MSETTRGVWAMLASALFFSATSALIRLAPDIDACTSTLYRFAIGMTLLGTAAMTGRIRLEFTSSSLLFSRGLVGGTAVFLFFWSINTIGLGKGTVLSYSYPVFATIWGIFLLGEKVSSRAWLLIVTAFGGFILTSLGRGDNLAGLGLPEAAALIGAVLSGLAVVIVRKLRATESSYAIFFSQCVIGFWLMLIPANIAPSAIGVRGGLILLGIGISAALGQLTMTYAFKALPVSKGSIIGLLTPVINIAVGMAAFHETVTLVSGVGMFLVLASCTLISIWE